MDNSLLDFLKSDELRDMDDTERNQLIFKTFLEALRQAAFEAAERGWERGVESAYVVAASFMLASVDGVDLARLVSMAERAYVKTRTKREQIKKVMSAAKSTGLSEQETDDLIQDAIRTMDVQAVIRRKD